MGGVGSQGAGEVGRDGDEVFGQVARVWPVLERPLAGQVQKGLGRVPFNLPYGGDNHGEDGVSDCKAAESGFCARSTFGLMDIPIRPPLNQSESLNGGPLLGNRATYD
jgi:hypothetical protein